MSNDKAIDVSAESGDEELLLDIDERDLTLGDLDSLEEVTGELPETGLDGIPRTKMLIGLALVALRREDPAATVADARAVKLTQLNVGDDAAEEGGGEVGPTE